MPPRGGQGVPKCGVRSGKSRWCPQGDSRAFATWKSTGLYDFHPGQRSSHPDLGPPVLPRGLLGGPVPIRGVCPEIRTGVLGGPAGQGGQGPGRRRPGEGIPGLTTERTKWRELAPPSARKFRYEGTERCEFMIRSCLGAYQEYPPFLATGPHPKRLGFVAPRVIETGAIVAESSGS